MKNVFRSILTMTLVALAFIASVFPLASVAKGAANLWEMLMQPQGRHGVFAANGLTRMIPDLYESLDQISRELVGFIPAVTFDAGLARVAVGQSVVIPITPSSTAADLSPGVTAPDNGDQTMENTTFAITKSRGVPFRWNGEEQRGVNSGPGYKGIRNQQMMQAMRTLVNEMEVTVGGVARLGSRAFGTAGTAPFGSSLSDINNALKILQDNGAPVSDLQAVVNTSASLNLRNLATLQQANTAGTDTLQRQGILLPISGFAVRESAGVASVTAGTVTGTVTAGAAAIGATSLTLTTAAGAAVSLSAGDVVTFAGSTNKYIVAATCTIGASTTGTLTIAAPGLVAAVAGASAVAAVSSFAANCFFDRSAIVLATRAPALPEEGDMADDRVMITDPRSGLAFEVSMYKQYRQIRYEVAAAWGAKNIKPAHSGVLLG